MALTLGGVALFLGGLLVGEYYNHKIDRIRREQLEEFKRRGRDR